LLWKGPFCEKNNVLAILGLNLRLNLQQPLLITKNSKKR
jgi:hypothetical protein